VLETGRNCSNTYYTSGRQRSELREDPAHIAALAGGHLGLPDCSNIEFFIRPTAARQTGKMLSASALDPRFCNIGWKGHCTSCMPILLHPTPMADIAS
jgi:hypothetical protein